jgi:hypothetical protein
VRSTDRPCARSERHLTAPRARTIVASTSFTTSQSVFDSFESLDLDAAKVLALIPKGGLLDLSGIRDLPDPVAAALAAYEGYLGLHSVESLSLPAARHLARHKGGVYLGGLKRVSVEVARVLLGCRDRVGLPNDLRNELKLQVACHETWMQLKLGPRLTASIAARIRSRNIQPFQITRCFRSLDKDAAEILLRKLPSYRLLDMSGLRTLSANTAALLARYKGSVDLSGLRAISDNAALAIAENFNRGGLDEQFLLDGMRKLPVNTARILARCRGWISLNGVETLTEQAAHALVNSECWFNLEGLRKLKDPVLGILAGAAEDNIWMSDVWMAKVNQLRVRRGGR